MQCHFIVAKSYSAIEYIPKWLWKYMKNEFDNFHKIWPFERIPMRTRNGCCWNCHRFGIHNGCNYLVNKFIETKFTHIIIIIIIIIVDVVVVVVVKHPAQIPSIFVVISAFVPTAQIRFLYVQSARWARVLVWYANWWNPAKNRTLIKLNLNSCETLKLSDWVF